MKEAPKPQMQNPEDAVGGGYLKPGQLRGSLTVEIDNRALAAGEEPGPRVVDGEYGQNVEVPVTVSGIPKRVQLNVKGADYAKCYTAFGGALDAWVGRRITLSNDPNLSMIRVAPAN